MKGMVADARPSRLEGLPKVAWQAATFSLRMQTPTRSSKPSALRGVPRFATTLLNPGVAASESVLQQ